MPLPINPSSQKDYRDDLGLSSSPWGVDDALIAPVKVIGAGIPRGNNAQALKTYSFSKTSVGGEVFYIQAATTTQNARIFFLGVAITDGGGAVPQVYIEDASDGNIAISDGGSVALFITPPDAVGYTHFALPFPRECKRGIRIALSVNALGTGEGLIYYLEERTDGNLEGL